MTTRDLLIVPLESLTERYTEQWARNLPPAFAHAGFNVKVIDGQPLLDNEINVGTFLDINSTVAFKMSQLQELARMFNAGEVQNGTIIFFSDIEFWGLESVRLMADMNEVEVKMAGFLHAASYTHGDAFAIAAPYQRYTEVGWIAALDMVFVGSSYHRRAVTERRLAPLNRIDLADRIVAAGNPIFPDEYPQFPDIRKTKLVVLTNRFDEEKDPKQTLDLFKVAKATHPDWEFAVCTGRKSFRSNNEGLVAYARQLEEDGVLSILSGLTKNEYHSILAQARVMVSHSPEENYGYCIAEAIQYDCMPLLRRGASHPEMVGFYPECLFAADADLGSQLQSLETAMSSDTQRQFQHLAPMLRTHHALALERITKHLVSL